MTDADLVQTRRALHAVAELVLAGPQYRLRNTIRLQISPGGFRTVTEPDLRVVGTDLVLADGTRRPITGATARTLAQTAGVEPGPPEGVYGDGSGVSLDADLSVEATAAARISQAYELGRAALRRLAPDEDPVLWPEHFDVGVRVGEINYGVSPGDGYLDEPYAYVGLDPVPAAQFWNAPFGAARPMTDFTDAVALHDFFVDGQGRVS